MWTSVFTLALAAMPAVTLGAVRRPHWAVDRRDGEALPIYRNSSHCVNDRVEDLIGRMTVEEKAGQMFHQMMYQGENGTLYDGPLGGNKTRDAIGKMYMTHFNLVGNIKDAAQVARFANLVQEEALKTRLGIPVTISTDPRHSFTEHAGTGFKAGVFSQWPESLGMAALRDAELVKKFAEVAREEYMAVGIRGALHPQVDLATEPRWARIKNTWGEDANLTSELLVAYIKGFQGEEIGPHSVTTVTKHFPGGGPQQNGEDSHFTYGQNATFPGKNMDYHIIPFKAAIAAGARQMMPYYSRAVGTNYEEVGFSFNKGIVTDLLQNELGFEGIVLTDWGLITDSPMPGGILPARAWGVQQLSGLERAAKILNAGCDQFGGEERTDLVIQLVKEGIITEERLNKSIRKLLREKFLLGLFDNPFVDPEAATRVVGNDYFVRLGVDAQRRSYTLLKNKDNILPLRNLARGTKFYIEGFNSTFVEKRNFTVVKTPEEADYALLRIQAPYEQRTGVFEANMNAGSLAYNSTEQERQAAIYNTVPTIADIILDRPAVIPEVIEKASAVFGSYGSSSEAFLDVILGESSPEGKLPFDLPSSIKAVEENMEDVPFDTRNPIFKFGHGLTYANRCAEAKAKSS